MSTNHSTRPDLGGAYARVSEKDQTSVPEQLDWARSAFLADGVELAATFEDQGIKGYEIELRPGLQQMLEFCERAFRQGNGLQVLAVWNLDRLSRADSLDTSEVLKRLRRAGVSRILTPERSWDLNEPADLVMLNLGQDMTRAAFSPKMSKDVLRSMSARAREGFWQGGPVPIGYRVEGRKLVPGPEWEVALVRRLFADYLKGFSTRDLARELNKEGIRSPRGKKWRDCSINWILHNPVYVGDLVWNAKHVGKFSRLSGNAVKACQQRQAREADQRRRGLKNLPVERNAREDVITVPNAYPALIDREIFDAVQADLRARNTDRSPARHTAPWVLSGLCVCGHCGAPMHCRPHTVRRGEKKERRAKFGCSRRIQEGTAACPKSGYAEHGVILRGVVRLLQERLGDQAAVDQLRRDVACAFEAQAVEFDAKRAALQALWNDLERDIAAGAARLLKIPEAVIPEVAAALERTKEQRDQVAAQLADLERVQAPAAAADGQRIERALGLVTQLDKLLDLADPDLLRATLRDLVAKVELTFPPLSPDQRRGKGSNKRVAGDPTLNVTLSDLFADLLCTACGTHS